MRQGRFPPWPIPCWNIEKVKVIKRELFDTKVETGTLLNRRYSSSLVSFYPRKPKATTPYLSAERDRSKTNNLHKRPDTRRVRRHKKTDNCCVGGREENGERDRRRGPRRAVSAKSRERIWPHGMSQETMTKFHEQNSVKELKRLKKEV